MEDLISVVDRYTGKKMQLAPALARDSIEHGSAVQTVPANFVAAEQWRDDLRAKIFAEAVQRGNEADIGPFCEFERWCATQGLHALPVLVEDVTRYLLSLLRDAAPKHEGTVKLYAIERIHLLSAHPPRDLSRQVLASLFRAIEFAKLRIPTKMGLTEEMDQVAARKALEMFPTGSVPKSYSDVA